MFVWVGIVSSILITSLLTTGLTSAVLDLIAFIIILSLGVRRLKARQDARNLNARKSHAQQDQQTSNEFNEEAKQISSMPGKIDITP